ncbi:flagellar M-ring protein FliF [Rhizobiales bacterium GAS191]|nr:flagellar M-ring protein FliF [Rhizobiales bacterium GAS113]SED39872.1 flagellar M-ring protein FliF [Rhizobiales bacterium GAS188]SEE94632.1 flagellar M-ring protein FliF [Rhizobiales bacterium GAS191]
MTVREQLERLISSLAKLGGRRLAILGIVGLAIFAVTGFAGYYLSRPSLEVLYAGLDRQDVSRIGSALREAGLSFDVNSDGNTVLVPYGQTAQARMLLAEKGLPHSANAGYELFDKLGSLGLTSFMQEVTRVRALEGELARTIQTMRGVKAARVHIVLPDEGSFRRNREPASASVVIRTESPNDTSSAQAIRHMVSAAVPGMALEGVTVLNTDGVMLASGSDMADTAPAGMLTLEKSVSQDIQDRIRKTLTPYLSARNFQISVATRLNTDKKQTNETIFYPESRVERSVRVVKETQVSQNSSTQAPTSVERNLPQDKNQSTNDGKQSNEDNQKREELTNYELSSKTVSTASAGFTVDNLSVAVLLNRASLVASLGGDKATPEAVEKQLADIEQLISSAAGLRKDHGDTIKIAAVDFADTGNDLEPVPPPSYWELAMRQSGTFVSAGTVLAVALLLIWFGIRPATRALIAAPSPTMMDNPLIQAGMMPGLDPMALYPDEGPGSGSQLMAMGDANLIEDLTNKARRSPQKRLEQIVQFDEDQATAILKQWIHQGERA